MMMMKVECKVSVLTMAPAGHIHKRESGGGGGGCAAKLVSLSNRFNSVSRVTMIKILSDRSNFP